MRFAAIENSDLMPARERITNLKWSSKAGPAKDEDIQRLGRFFSKQASGADRSSGSGSEFNEATTRRDSIHVGGHLLSFCAGALVASERDELPVAWLRLIYDIKDMNRRTIAVFLTASAIFAISNYSYCAENDLADIKAEVTKRHDEAVKRLQDWIKLPSIAAENRGYPEGAEYMAKLAKDAGFQQATVIKTEGKPGVFATLDAGAPKTVGLYFMYDVKQFDPAEWTSPPLDARLVDKPGLRQGDGRSRGGESEGAGSGVPRGAACDQAARARRCR